MIESHSWRGRGTSGPRVAEVGREGSEEVGAGGDFGIGHGVTEEGAFGCLNADVGHGEGGGAFEVAIAIGGNADHGSFGNVKHLVVDLKFSGTGKDDVVFFVCLVGVEEWDLGTCGEGTERDFTGCGTGGIFYKLLALEPLECANRSVGEFFALVQNLYFAHRCF